MYSEQQSQVLLTLKDLANEKLLQMKTEILNTLKEVRKEGNVAVKDLSVQLSSLAEASRSQKTLCILNSLDFETRQSRQSDISDTEYRTFQWIFRDHHGPFHKHVGFRNWLQFGNDIYWISGKAGSGKSVLMNYIANEAFTRQTLQSWAGDTRLIIADYFFWNAGAPMQKSQQGLLQSLLREICGQCPEIVPVVCSSRWNRYHEIGATWSRLELSEAFRNLSQQRLLKLKFCFFVDGVDEYEGEDYTHIIDTLKDLNASPSVKICLSSRPWNIFITAFGANTDQRILLEDHNGDDIQEYVKNKFENDKHFALLQSRDPSSSDLVDQIVQNAQGVFLWVKIVVGNLLRGLKNDDSLSDLHKRLQGFPTNLTAYFQHMFDSIDEFYREETSEILLICLEGIQPLSLLALWFYEQERVTADYALRKKRSPLSRANYVAIFEGIHKRINARGQDLLVIEANGKDNVHSALMYTVRFSHRTVKDFLLRPDMMKKLSSWKSKDFDAQASLCKATLAIVKSLSNRTHMTHRVSHMAHIMNVSEHISDFFTYAHLIEQNRGKLDDVLVDEFQHVIASYREPDTSDSFSERLTYSKWGLDYWAHWVDERDTGPVNGELGLLLSCWDRDLSRFFFVSAIESSLKSYIEYKLATKPHLVDRSYRQRPILDRALRPPPSLWPTRRIDPDIIHLLLRRGANPNEALTVYRAGSNLKNIPFEYASEKAWTTVWALFLQRLHEANIRKIHKPPDIVYDELEATKLMIEHGAAADLRPWRILALQEPLGGPILTPSDVFHEVFPARDAVLLDQLLRKHRPWALQQACSCVRRTTLLWFYRDIHIVVWSLSSLFSIFFNETTGVILPMVFIPMFLYCLWFVWPFVSFLFWRTAPVLLPVLVLSDWIPILDGLIWFNGLLVWRDSSLVFNRSKNLIEF